MTSLHATSPAAKGEPACDFRAGIASQPRHPRPAPRRKPPPPATAVATFAGGCFWCVEADFDKVAGVISTTSGYIGGMVANPTYEQVSPAGTGHTEAVEVVYDPAKVSYERLLDVFWQNHDPLAKDRQFCDRGNQYRPGDLLSQRRAARARGGDQEEAVRRASSSRSRPRSPPRRRSTRPRTITRTTTRRIRRATNSTASTAAATRGSKSCGASPDHEHDQPPQLHPGRRRARIGRRLAGGSTTAARRGAVSRSSAPMPNGAAS